jgi:hypothetical protein
MTNQQLPGSVAVIADGKVNTDELKRRCRTMLESDGISPDTKNGKRCIVAFWIGALQTLPPGVPMPAFVSICLMSGRTEELISKDTDAR